MRYLRQALEIQSQLKNNSDFDMTDDLAQMLTNYHLGQYNPRIRERLAHVIKYNPADTFKQLHEIWDEIKNSQT